MRKLCDGNKNLILAMIYMLLFKLAFKKYFDFKW